MQRNQGSGIRNQKSERRAISLLEVLISMFVMLVGLLGVASLIPVGRFEVQRGAKIDRASACGRAAFRDLKIRRMLDPNSWALFDGNLVYPFAPAAQFCFDGVTAAGSRTGSNTPVPFCIDPLGVSAGFGALFPSYLTATAPSPVPAAPIPPSAPYLPRITLGPNAAMNATVRAAIADTVFRSQDELGFDPGASADLLPAQVLQKDTSANSLKRLSEGNYTWLATIVPDANLLTTSNTFENPCRVSVAVFYKRNLAVPSYSERTCAISPASSGGGEITLTTAGVTLPTGVTAAEHLTIAKPNQWMMLGGWVDPDGAGVIPPRWSYKWYRIATADEVQLSGSDYVRNLTIVGPDWTAPTSQVTAFLFDGIVALYERDMTLEADSMY